MQRSPNTDLSAPLIAGLALAVCCGAPLAVALLVTTGVGATLVGQGWVLAGAALTAIGVVLGARYLVRVRARAQTPSAAAVEDCCAPLTQLKKETRT